MKEFKTLKHVKFLNNGYIFQCRLTNRYYFVSLDLETKILIK